MRGPKRQVEHFYGDDGEEQMAPLAAKLDSKGSIIVITRLDLIGDRPH